MERYYCVFGKIFLLYRTEDSQILCCPDPGERVWSVVRVESLLRAVAPLCEQYREDTQGVSRECLLVVYCKSVTPPLRNALARRVLHKHVINNIINISE